MSMKFFFFLSFRNTKKPYNCLTQEQNYILPDIVEIKLLEDRLVWFIFEYFFELLTSFSVRKHV